MNHITLSPAYGADYRSQAEAAEAFHGNKDFIIETVSNRWHGKPANKQGLMADGYTEFTIRFAKQRKVVFIK